MQLKYLFSTVLALLSLTSFSQESQEITYTNVQVYPVLSGCEDSKPINLRECFELGVAQHVAETFTYTEAARKENIKGTIIVSFIVDKEGNITDPKITQGIAGNYTGNESQVQQAMVLEKNALASIKGLKITSPAIQAGKPVRFKYSFPLETSLQ